MRTPATKRATSSATNSDELTRRDVRSEPSGRKAATPKRRPDITDVLDELLAINQCRKRLIIYVFDALRLWHEVFSVLV